MATTPARVEVDARSMVCIGGVPGMVGDREYFVPLPGGRQRRPVRVGDHLDSAHPLVAAFPHAFAPSGELPDVMVIGVETEEARQARMAATVRLDPLHCRKIVPACARCGQESQHAVVLLEPPTALDLNSALTGIEDHDYAGRMRIEQTFAAMVRASDAQAAELTQAENEWREQHSQCPPGTPPLPEPQAPTNPPLFFRRSEVRGAG
jgi:hypothetical protein